MSAFSAELTPAEKQSKRKNISIDIETWERLKTFGKFGESFDDLLNRMMDSMDKKR